MVVVSSCREGVGLSAITGATLIYSYHQVMLRRTLWTAVVRCEEGGDDVKISTALTSGATRVTMGVQKAATGDRMLIPKNLSQFGLESATRLHEAGFASNRASATAR